jgi:hypothetical protein
MEHDNKSKKGRHMRKSFKPFVCMLGLILCVLGIVLFDKGCCRKSKYDGIIFEKCTAENPLRMVLDFMPFGDFKPGIHFDAARIEFGEPERIWTEMRQTTCHLYAGAHGDVAIVQEIQVSGGLLASLPTLTNWTVYAYPPMGKPTFDFSLLINKNIREAVERHRKPCTLVLHGEMNEDMIRCDVLESGISKIRWINRDSKENSGKR